MEQDLVVAFIGSYPPRACGIATFTQDLSEAVARSGRNIATRIAAINDEGATYLYPPQVRWTVDQYDPQSWKNVAHQINRSRISLVSVQHEFGIFGKFDRAGAFIDHLAGFLDHIENQWLLPYIRSFRTRVRTNERPFAVFMIVVLRW